MADPPSKRRKLDPSATLSRPFKSPFRTPIKKSTEDTPLPKPTAPSSSEQQSKITTTTTQQTIITPLRSRPFFPSSSPSSSSTSTSTSTLIPTTPPTNPDAVLSTLLRTHTDLHNSLLTARTLLDTHTQALGIETAGKDAELARLVGVWRGAAREAAELLFGGVRDRVNRMGGVRAWRERERERDRGFGAGGGWDDGGGSGGREGDGGDGDGSGDEGVDEEGDEERKEREEAVEEEERARMVELESGDEEGFTMDMMLRSLNIELDVIGFDKDLQRWVD